MFSAKFWVSAFTSTLVTLLMLYLIKKIAGVINVPVVSEVANAV